jgi:GNAT superfamily N-acetyltransferase
MHKTNIQRLYELAEETFAMRSDPEQLQVDETVIERLKKIHPAALNESRDENGPVAWLLVIPTTQELMERFVAGEINENQLYEMTPVGRIYDALYLCSALVLEEYRRKGIASGLAMQAIEAIRKDHPLKALFVWAFTNEGDKAAEMVAKETGLNLFKRANVTKDFLFAVRFSSLSQF